jgi:hypothetical protein
MRRMGILLTSNLKMVLFLCGSLCLEVDLKFFEKVFPQTLQRQRGLPMPVLPKAVYAPGVLVGSRLEKAPPAGSGSSRYSELNNDQQKCDFSGLSSFICNR